MLSVVWLLGVLLVLVSLVPLPVDVCARAPNATSASASAIPMILIEPPRLCSDRSGDSGAQIQPSRARAVEARRERCSLASTKWGHPRALWAAMDIPGEVPLAYAENEEPHPHVCLAFGFLKLNPLCPNWPST